MSNISKLGAISAVEDLTDAAAAVVEGGGGTNGIGFFDNYQATKLFLVSRGGSVRFKSTIDGPSGRSFAVSLTNTGAGRSTSPKTVAYKKGSAFWSNVRGGVYVIEMTDNPDNLKAWGSYEITST